ncbi:hypothetical protein CYMTET_30743 [Cymbomonas tetramitiformis]|uniref:Uncharacterized protein n=1 Tax=Cymbomonas tetramitiformis TaxID=36881 RepID=A0AAE0FIH3_9CHLO|nr:hypothetical protein CYMTET_30743 [Cymbomonas tetramitiformis]
MSSDTSGSLLPVRKSRISAAQASFDNLIEREQRKSQLLEGEGHSSRRDPLTQQLHQQFGTRQESLGSQAWHGNSFKYDNPFFIPTTEDGTICTHEEPMILRFLKGNIDTSSFRKTPCFRAAIGIVTAALLLFLTYTSQTLVRNGENYSLGENPWYKSRATVSAVKAAVSHMNALKQPVPPPPPTPPPETPELGSMHKVERLRELRTRFEHDIKTFEDGETYDALTRSRPTKGNPQRLTHFFAKLAQGKRAVIACIGSPNSTAGAYSGTVNAPRSPTYGSLLLDWIARTFPSSNDMDGHIYLNLGTPPKSPLKGTMFWLHCASEFFARRGEDLSGLGMKDVDLWLVELAVEDILLMQEMHLRSKWHYIETFVRHLLQQPGEPAVLFVYLGQKSSLTTPAFIPNGTFVADDLWWREHMMDPTMLNAQGLYELVSTYYGPYAYKPSHSPFLNIRFLHM